MGAALVVLVCILVPVSVLAVWLHNTVLDTDEYVATVAPLVHDPAVQEAIATRVTNSLLASSDLDRRLADALPARSPVSASASRTASNASSMTRHFGSCNRTRSRHRSPLRVVVAAVGLAVLVAFSHPGPGAVLTVAVLVLVCLAFIEALSRNASVRASQ